MNVIYIFVELIDIELKCMFYIAGKFQTDAGSGWFINFSRFEIFSTFLVLILLRVTWIQLYRKYPSENDLNTAIRCIEYSNTALQTINGFQVPASHCSHSLPRAATDSDLQIMEILILLCTHPGPQIRDTRSGCQGQLWRFLIPRLFNSILCNAMPFIWGTAIKNYDISISISFSAIQLWAHAGHCRRTDLKILHSAWHRGSDHGSEWWSDQTFLNAMPFFWGWKSNLQIPKLYHVNATDTFWETTIHSDSQQATFDQHVSFIGIFHTCHQMLRTNNHQTK